MQFIPATKDRYSDIANLVSSPEELYLVYPDGSYPWDTAQLDVLAETRPDFTQLLHNFVALGVSYRKPSADLEDVLSLAKRICRDRCGSCYSPHPTGNFPM